MIEKASAIVGSQAALARAIGVTPQYLYELKTTKRAIPARLCIPIRKATNGAIHESEIRPDIYPPEEYRKAG